MVSDLWKQAIFISEVHTHWLTQQLPVTDGQVTTERNVANWTMIMTSVGSVQQTIK
jgi:hypothetical protein